MWKMQRESISFLHILVVQPSVLSTLYIIQEVHPRDVFSTSHAVPLSDSATNHHNKRDVFGCSSDQNHPLFICTLLRAVHHKTFIFCIQNSGGHFQIAWENELFIMCIQRSPSLLIHAIAVSGGSACPSAYFAQVTESHWSCNIPNQPFSG